MKIYAIYKNNQFIIGFPSREDAENYGRSVLGEESGWEYDIREFWGSENKPNLYPLTQPYSPYNPPPLTTPGTVPCSPYWSVIPPYGVFSGYDGPKGPSSGPGPIGVIVDNGPFAPGTK